VGRHPVGLPAAEKAPNRLSKGFTKNIPECDVDCADRRDRNSPAPQFWHGVTRGGSPLMPDAIVEHFPDLDDVRGITTYQTWRNLVVQHVAQRRICPCAAGRVLAFAPTYESVIRLDPQDRRVEGRQLPEIAAMLTARLDRNAHPPGRCRYDAHIKTRPR